MVTVMFKLENVKMTTQLTDRRKPGSVLERHVSTLMLAIIIALVSWFGKTVLDNNHNMNEQSKVQIRSQAEMVGSINILSLEMRHLKALLEVASKDRYTGRDATRDNKIQSQRCDRFEKRLQYLENYHKQNFNGNDVP